MWWWRVRWWVVVVGDGGTPWFAACRSDTAERTLLLKIPVPLDPLSHQRFDGQAAVSLFASAALLA